VPLTGFEGGLNLLHVADDDTGICSDCSTREIINKLTIYCTFCSLADIFFYLSLFVHVFILLGSVLLHGLL